jgi:hypothetical protein
MSGDPLHDLDVPPEFMYSVTPVFQPAPRHYVDPGFSIQSSHDSCQRKEKVEHLNLTLGASVQAKIARFFGFECTGTSCSFTRFSRNRNQRVPPRSQ